MMGLCRQDGWKMLVGAGGTATYMYFNKYTETRTTLQAADDRKEQ
jgi:hypothetical protein